MIGLKQRLTFYQKSFLSGFLRRPGRGPGYVEKELDCAFRRYCAAQDLGAMPCFFLNASIVTTLIISAIVLDSLGDVLLENSKGLFGDFFF